MEDSRQESQQDVHFEENAQQGQESPQGAEQEYQVSEEATEQEEKQKGHKSKPNNDDGSRSGFIHGLSTGLGIGCIATFVIIWVAVFFTPQLPSGVTYESLLAIFIYPLIYLLAVGLVALTAGIVRQYFSRNEA